MKNETELQVQAYLDNELTPAEARKLAEVISMDPEAHALYAELRETRQALAIGGELAATVPETRDFYWSQIERRIQAEQPRVVPASGWRWWMRLAAPMAGAAALFAILLSLPENSRDSTGDLAGSPAGTVAAANPYHQIESTPQFSTITFRSESEGITVVWVDTQQ